MRYTLLIIAVCLLFTACKKDKFTTAPQIKYKSVKPNTFQAGNTDRDAGPVITVSVTDAEGDLGKPGKDTVKIYVKNLLTGKIDSTLEFPDIAAAAHKDFQGELSINVWSLMPPNNPPRPRIDTLYFEVYIKDFAKNKSNVIKTDDPIFFITP